MVLLCLSDIHGEGAGIEELLRSSSNFDLVLLAGDLTHLGGAKEAARIVDPIVASGARLLAVPGNMDQPGVLALLAERGVLLHGRGQVVGEVGFLGLGGSNPTPFGTPFEIPDEEAAGLLETAWPSVQGTAVRVLVSHAPPRGTRVDRSFSGLHAGSEEVRRFLESHDVDLCLCGHIHEAAGEDTVGRARCVNTGAWKNGRYVVITLPDESTGPGIRIDWRRR